MGDSFVGPDGALGEHIRLALEIAFLVQHFQRAEQTVAGILTESKAVAATVYQAVFLREIIVESVQLFLFLPNIPVRVTLGLQLNQAAGAVPESNHPPDTVLRGYGRVHRVHTGVFTKINLTVHDGITKVAHIGVGGDGAVFLVQILHFIGGDFSMKILDGFVKLLGQIRTFNGFAGAVHAKPGRFHDHPTQHHLRVLHKIAVHPYAVFVGVQMHPIRFNVRHTVTLLQKQDIAGDFGAGVAFEGIVRQTYSTYQICSLCKILADSAVFFVHGALAGDERHDTTGAHLVQRLAEKIIMNEPVIFVIPLVQHLEIAEGNVADSHVKKAVRHLHLFKTVHHNAAVLVELLGYPAGYAVKFNAVGFCPGHGFRQHTNEIADTAGRFQDVAGLKAHLSQCLVHSPNNNRGSVKGGQTAGPGCGVFILVQQGFQLQVFAVALVEAVG